MRRGHFIKETSQSEDELIFYCDCNNNVIERVSNTDLFVDYHYYSFIYSPLYIEDPVDSSRYCIKKRQGYYYVPCIIGDYRGETVYPFTVASSQTHTTETSVKFLASPTCGNHRVGFYWYCAPAITNSAATIFSYSGQGNNNSNQNNSGIDVIAIGSNVLFRAKNNSTTSLDTIIGSREDLKNKWYYIELNYFYISSTQYYVEFFVKDPSDGTIIVSNSHTLTQPLLNTKGERGRCTFLTDSFGDGGWAENIDDYIKEVKVWKIK